MIARLDEKIKAAALKYCLARNAVFFLAQSLGQDVSVTELPYLRKNDITPLWDDSESQYAKDRKKKEKKPTKRLTVNGTNATSKAVSWIWKRLGKAAVQGDESLQEGKRRSVHLVHGIDYEYRSTH
jgi:hypothetical protein